MSDETTLLPCPFCGGEASKRLFYKGKYRVHCNVCDAHSGGVYDTEAEAIAAWNTRAELGSGTKPCYAADENYKRCKYSVNRGWCDNAPFLVWDDTGHLFITMGGLKTWDVTDDAKKWFAELGSGTCENVSGVPLKFKCSECGDVWSKPSVDEFRFCPNCGKRVSA